MCQLNSALNLSHFHQHHTHANLATWWSLKCPWDASFTFPVQYFTYVQTHSRLSHHALELQNPALNHILFNSAAYRVAQGVFAHPWRHWQREIYENCLQQGRTASNGSLVQGCAFPGFLSGCHVKKPIGSGGLKRAPVLRQLPFNGMRSMKIPHELRKGTAASMSHSYRILIGRIATPHRSGLCLSSKFFSGEQLDETKRKKIRYYMASIYISLEEIPFNTSSILNR